MLRKIISTIVYSHLWIAFCASALILQTEFLLSDSWQITPPVILVFAATLVLYAVHRLIGLQKLKAINVSLNPRYQDISKAKPVIILSVLFGILLGINAFLKLSPQGRSWLIIPAVISLGYVVPIPGFGKRLRDIGMIKLFLIALVYGLVTVLFVYVEKDLHINKSAWILFTEKTLFIWAITIPFDIRDIGVDAMYGTRTLPGSFGEKKSKSFAISALIICSILIWINSVYYFHGKVALTLAYIISILLVQQSSQERNDLYYSFLIDGLMVLQILFLGLSLIFRG